MRTVRRRRDLLDHIAELEQRITTLETARRLGTSSVDSGELSIRGGDIVVRNANGLPVLKILHGDSPEIQLLPDSEVGDDYNLNLFGYESEDLGAAVQLSVQRIDGGTSVQDGGKLLLMRDCVFLSHQPDVGNEAYISIAGIVGYEEHFWLRGRWIDDLQVDGSEAIACGTVSIGAGFSSYTHTWDSPMDTNVGVVYGLQNSAGVVDHALTANSTTGFTIAWSGTAAKTLHFWAFRL